MEHGQFEEAALYFAQSIALCPHFKTLELQGECLLRLGRWREAIVPLAAASTLNLGVRAPSLLAEAFLLLGESHDATFAAELALSRDPKNRKALSVQAGIRAISHGDG